MNSSKIWPLLAIMCISSSRADPLNKITLKPDFIIEITENPQNQHPHTISYDGPKDLKIPIEKLVDLRHKNYKRQIITGKFSVKNGLDVVIELNQFEVCENKVLVRSNIKGLVYLFDREMLLRMLNEEIIINWDNWSDVGDTD